MAMPHSIEDEAVATEAVDVGALLKENASLRDRLLRALAEAENTRRQASRTAEDARRFAIADFAPERLSALAFGGSTPSASRSIRICMKRCWKSTTPRSRPAP